MQNLEQIPSNYSAQNGSESRFRDKCLGFFSVDLCYILWSVLLYHLICILPLVELIAPLEWYCDSVSQYYLSFKLSGMVVFFHLFCHLSFYFFAPAAFILELHRCSKGRSIS